MEMFTSADLQRRTGAVQGSAGLKPIAITDYGKPRNVMLSVEEFVRLKRAAREPVPEALLPKRSVVVDAVDDPLGYDVDDIAQAARSMAEDVRTGRTRDAIEAELSRVRERFAGPRP